MCRAVKCDVCGKTTWAGCGQHVDSVKAGVPAGQWCDGRHESGAATSGTASSAGAASTSDPAPRGGLLGRIFGR